MSLEIRDPERRIPATNLIVVQDMLQKRGIKNATMRPGAEGVVWVVHGTYDISTYYVFDDGKLVDIEVD